MNTILFILRIFSGLLFGISLIELIIFVELYIKGNKRKAMERLLYFLMIFLFALIIMLLNENLIAPNIDYLE